MLTASMDYGRSGLKDWTTFLNTIFAARADLLAETWAKFAAFNMIARIEQARRL